MASPLQTTKGVLSYRDPLSALQTKQLWKMLKRESTTDNSVASPGETLFLLVARVLHTTKLLDADQFWCVLSEARDHIIRAGEAISQQMAHHEGCGTIYTIAFADRHYVTWSGATGWLELSTGEWHTLIQPPPIESIAYNLNCIAEEGVEFIQQAQQAAEATDATQQEPARRSPGK